MTYKSEIIHAGNQGKNASQQPDGTHSHARNFIEIVVVFALIIAAVWTPQGRLNAFFSISAAACVVAFAIASPWSSREMGLAQPLAGVGRILMTGAILCLVVWLAGLGFRFAGPGYAIPLNRSWQYAVWALVQEFILQSIFFVRFESALGSRRAVLFSALLYSVAHIPNPVLTPLSFIGGLLFCELFRRYRNIFPLGIIHAALGLVLALSLPDKWLHHMRVGIGYAALH
jgi:hypothetical protein